MTGAAAASQSEGGAGSRSPDKERRERPSTFALIVNNRLAAVGLVVLGLIVLAALAAPILPLADPNATEPASRLAPLFSEGHLLAASPSVSPAVNSSMPPGSPARDRCGSSGRIFCPTSCRPSSSPSRPPSAG